jgi:hypothetical protein
MSRIQVETSVVEAAAAQVKRAGVVVREAATDLAIPLGSDPGFQAAAAAGRFCSTWSSALTAYADTCDSVAGRLSNAGIVYEVTEAHVSEAF